MVNIGRIDLNLLLTLDRLLAEQNVTRAAQLLNLSQPSVSVQLAKLRDIFDDPLLLPGPRGMLPTARANELRGPLRQAIETLERAIAPAKVFDPTEARHTWRIAASDYSESTLLLSALDTLRSVAPHTRLAIYQISPPRISKQTEQGEIDLAFHTMDDPPQDLHHRVLYKEQYVLASRVGHPILKGKPTLKQFSRLEHAIVSTTGGGFHGITDNMLADVGLTRRVVLSVPHFLFILSVLAKTDLVAMLPARIVRNHPQLQIVEPPVDIPGFDMSMFWHERSHRDPAHQWLRQFILDAV